MEQQYNKDVSHVCEGSVRSDVPEPNSTTLPGSDEQEKNVEGGFEKVFRHNWLDSSIFRLPIIAP